MKKLTLLLTAVSLAAGASVAFAQPAASAVSSYSPPTVKHVKKPKKHKMKKGASEPMAAPANSASQ